MFPLRQIQLILCFLFVRWWFWGFLAEEFLWLFLWNDFLFLQSLHFSSLETHMWQFLITKNTPSDSWLGSCSSFRNLPFKFFSEPVFLNIYGARNGFQGMISASLCSLAGRYNNPIYSSSVPSPHRLFKNSSSVYPVAAEPINYASNLVPAKSWMFTYYLVNIEKYLGFLLPQLTGGIRWVPLTGHAHS